MQIRAAYLLIDSQAEDAAARVSILAALRALHDQGVEIHLVTDGAAEDLPPDLQALAASLAGSGDRTLFAHADVALRDAQVRSAAPGVGRWIAAVRRTLTGPLKDEYLDIIVERQVAYNQELAAELERLQAEVRDLQARMDALRRTPPSSV